LAVFTLAGTGGSSGAACICFVITLAVQVPFLEQPF
jgi:hypothetical protein